MSRLGIATLALIAIAALEVAWIFHTISTMPTRP